MYLKRQCIKCKLMICNKQGSSKFDFLGKVNLPGCVHIPFGVNKRKKYCNMRIVFFSFYFTPNGKWKLTFLRKPNFELPCYKLVEQWAQPPSHLMGPLKQYNLECCKKCRRRYVFHKFWKWYIEFLRILPDFQILHDSAGQIFCTFNVMDFLWSPWGRKTNFEYGRVWNYTLRGSDSSDFTSLETLKFEIPPFQHMRPVHLKSVHFGPKKLINVT